ncbi:Hypothetical predicted protein [Cloeon dipterum]|uniref:Uncharacterized protein n=1 Tax=Cloeon dipterum TaxID=197152 RepID=A0A8S1DDK0_9INSE|nr:Hypothetical predicted protein [Cloeon dipterum]
MNTRLDPARDETTMQHDNQHKRRGRKVLFTDEANIKTGFCVICENELGDIRYHMVNFHLNIDTAENHCYELYPFKGRRIMAPKEENLNTNWTNAHNAQVRNAETILMTKVICKN